MELAKKRSVSLPQDLLASVDELAGKSRQRSKLIENVLRDFVQKKLQMERDRRELQIINANAEKLNEEALDVLEYQQVNW